MHKRGLCRHPVSVGASVRPSVTLVHSVKKNKYVFEIFLPSSSHTILVFPYQTSWQYSDRNPPNGGVEWRWGRQKSRFWAYIWLHCLLLTLQQARCCQHGRRWTTATVPEVVTLISYTAGMQVFDHQAPRAIISHRRRGSTAPDRPSKLSHYTQSRSTVNRVYDSN